MELHVPPGKKRYLDNTHQYTSNTVLRSLGLCQVKAIRSVFFAVLDRMFVDFFNHRILRHAHVYYIFKYLYVRCCVVVVVVLVLVVQHLISQLAKLLGANIRGRRKSAKAWVGMWCRWCAIVNGPCSSESGVAPVDVQIDGFFLVFDVSVSWLMANSNSN